MGNQLSANKESAPKIESLRKNRQRITSPPNKIRLKKKSRKIKSNNPPSAYALFIRDVRNSLFDQNITFKELSMSCSRKWREMTDQQKSKYHQKAKQIRETMLRFGGRAVRKARKVGPLRKKNMYWNFAQIMRPIIYNELKEKYGTKPEMRAVNREVGNQWRHMTPEAKESYRNI